MGFELGTWTKISSLQICIHLSYTRRQHRFHLNRSKRHKVSVKEKQFKPKKCQYQLGSGAHFNTVMANTTQH